MGRLGASGALTFVYFLLLPPLGGFRRHQVAQEGYDTLIALTDSRYRLSMIVARRAAQLKSGIPPVLDVTQLPRTENSVTIAMKELELTQDVKWGDDLPSSEELKRVAAPPKPEPAAVFTPAPLDEDDA